MYHYRVGAAEKPIRTLACEHLGNGRGGTGGICQFESFLQPSSPHRPSSSPLLPYLQELGIMHESLQLFTGGICQLHVPFLFLCAQIAVELT